MPKNINIKSIMIIGSGPIVIGQGCEFDYSGVQACKLLKAEGYRIILVNSNPASIMTDIDLCDATYIEPIHWESIEKIIEKERPDALLPTMGGQTALNCTIDLVKKGILKKYSVELIGATEETIYKAEDRRLFRKAMQKIGLEMPLAKIAKDLDSAVKIQKDIGFPTVVRPSFTLGGTGGGIAKTEKEFKEICIRGLELSPKHELLIEESLLGWKEFELEVLRDTKNNCIIVCSIENLDPMGIHTGDSITVAPAQTLTDKEYQLMRNAAKSILKEVGIETGGANVQFAIHPETGKMVVIEMNPRVSRSSALASKATGFPIAKIAAKLAIGYTLDELSHDFTMGKMPASFEPTIDYVVTKIPRFNFEKFPTAYAYLNTQMKSVGEVMAIGRTFQEALQKALCSLECGLSGLEQQLNRNLEFELKIAGPNRILFIADAFRRGLSLKLIADYTKVDPWFLAEIEDLVSSEQGLCKDSINTLTREKLLTLKQKGFSDRRIAILLNSEEKEVRLLRHKFKIFPSFKRVDGCAAEFPTEIAYLYSTYEEECEAYPTDREEKIIILGSGPNRIGQGLEFDYCCVHVAIALREQGYETIMVNCNPETVSTDYDVSDKLYFEPITLENILEIVRIEKPKGVIVQYGGQTPLKLAKELQNLGVPILGTSPDSIDCTENRKRFADLVKLLGLNQPEYGLAHSLKEGLTIAKKLGYPIIVRPSYVLGGHAMEIVWCQSELSAVLNKAFYASPADPVFLDKFLENAKEVDIDAISDGIDVYIGGILEHVELAGIHSGDSICCIPPFSITQSIQDELQWQMQMLIKAILIVGPVNAQFAIQKDKIFILEVNPRGSRTIPFVSKAAGIPLVKMGTLCMINRALKDQIIPKSTMSTFFSIKLPVFPFDKFPEVDSILGPEMRSTGESMGIGKSFSEAFCKSIFGIWQIPKLNGKVFLSSNKKNMMAMIEIGKELIELGFELTVCAETAKNFNRNRIYCIQDKVDAKLNFKEIIFAIIATENPKIIKRTLEIRKDSIRKKVTYITTIPAAKSVINQMKYQNPLPVYCLQEINNFCENQ